MYFIFLQAHHQENSYFDPKHLYANYFCNVEIQQRVVNFHLLELIELCLRYLVIFDYTYFMKKISLYIFLGLMWCNFGVADNFNYLCFFERYFQVADGKKWEFNNVKFNFYNDGDKLKIHNKNIDVLYSFTLEIVTNDSNEIVAGGLFENKINTFVLNKNTLYAKYTNLYFDKEGGAEFSIGKCD